MISKRLGISDEIISRAKEKITDTNIRIEDLLKEIYENKRIIEKEKSKTLNNSIEIEKQKLEYEEKNKKLKEIEKNLIIEAKEKASQILLDAKEDVDNIIRDLEKTNSSKEANLKRKELNKKIEEFSNLNISKSKTILKKEDLKVNDEVYIPRINSYGLIISISKNNCTVQIGSIKSNFKFSELELSHKKQLSDDKTHSIKREFKPISVSSEINVIGQNVDEACFVIDKYLDTCFLNGLTTVRIVHGKGTGKLRQGIQEFLKSHPHVKSYRLGTFGEGEMGVTVVEIK